MYYIKNELSHHGILGQKWGVRRFQNVDGTRKKSLVSNSASHLATNRYIPKDLKDAQVYMQKKALTMAALIAVGQTAVMAYFSKNMDIKLDSKMLKTAAVTTGMAYTANVLMDEIGYLRTGSIKKM